MNRNWKPTGQPVSSCRFTPSLFFASLSSFVTVTYSFVGLDVRVLVRVSHGGAAGAECQSVHISFSAFPSPGSKMGDVT